jgi:transcriptional regulator with XRE-family HTH domain
MSNRVSTVLGRISIMMFYEKLKHCREQLCLSQEDIAEKLYVSRQAVSKWERGVNEPDIETIVRLSDIYGVTIDDLLREDLSVVRKLAVKERSYKKLIIAVAILGMIFLLMLLTISLQTNP